MRGSGYSTNDQRLDELMMDLQRKQRQLAEDGEKAQRARQEAEQASREAQVLRAQLQEAEQEARRGLKKKLGEQFQRARAEVQATVDSLKHEQKLIKAKETKQRLHELETRAKQELVPASKPIPLEQLGIGDTVEIVGLGMTGSLLETPQGKKRVRVKVGEGEILATVSSLVGLAGEYGSAHRLLHHRKVPVGFQLAEDWGSTNRRWWMCEGRPLMRHSIRSSRRWIGRLRGAPYLRIIHGHGTGRLKSALREYLKDSPYVAEFRPGESSGGRGWGENGCSDSVKGNEKVIRSRPNRGFSLVETVNV